MATNYFVIPEIENFVAAATTAKGGGELDSGQSRESLGVIMPPQWLPASGSIDTTQTPVEP